MKSTLGTLICFLILGFFLIASTGRAQSAPPPAVSYYHASY